MRGGELTVRDHGPGISVADERYIFDRFYRAPQARAAPGAGLGLSVVSDVAQAHGGIVAAESAPDGGALFRLSFPAATIPAATIPAATIFPSATRPTATIFPAADIASTESSNGRLSLRYVNDYCL